MLEIKIGFVPKAVLANAKPTAKLYAFQFLVIAPFRLLLFQAILMKIP